MLDAKEFKRNNAEKVFLFVMEDGSEVEGHLLSIEDEKKLFLLMKEMMTPFGMTLKTLHEKYICVMRLDVGKMSVLHADSIEEVHLNLDFVTV